MRETDRPHVEAMVEACDSAEHLLAVREQLLQLILNQHGIQWGALLDQFLSEHDQRIDLICVQRDLLLERLQDTGTHMSFNTTYHRNPFPCSNCSSKHYFSWSVVISVLVPLRVKSALTFSCLILSWTSLLEKCSTLVSCKSISVSHTRTASLVPSNSSLWDVKCCREQNRDLSRTE